MIRPDQLQRLEELLSQPDMVPCMPLLRSDVAALLAAYKAKESPLAAQPIPPADWRTQNLYPISYFD